MKHFKKLKTKIYEKRRELYKKYYEFRRKNIKGDQDLFPMYTSFPEIKKSKNFKN